MARKIEVPFTANPREFLRGLKIMSDKVENLEDDLGKVGDAGDDAADEIAKSAKRAARELDDIADETGDAEKAFGRLGRSASADMRKAERAADRLDDELGDVEKEAGQSAKEFGSAFRGDPVEALEEVQSYIAEIVNVKLPGFGGALFAIAGGAAASAVISFYERWREEQERRTEQIREWRDAALDAFDDVGRFEFSREDLLGGFTDQLDEAGRRTSEFAEDLANTTPEIEQAFARAFQTNDPEDYARAQELVGRTYEALVAKISAEQGTWTEQAEAVKRTKDAIGTYGTELVEGIIDAEAFAETANATVTPSAEDMAAAIEGAADAVRDLSDNAFTAADEALDNYEAGLDEATAAANTLTADGVQPLTGGLDGETEAARDAKETLRDLAGDTLAAAAAQVQLDGDTAGATETTEEGRRKFIEVAQQLGLTEQQAGDYATQLGLIPGDVRTSIVAEGLAGVLANIEAYTASLNALDGRTFTVKQVTDFVTTGNAGPANDYGLRPPG